MKLSIIVPVYMVEPYLRRCIDSILSQTFTDFELILVDDGSPDNCPSICDEYAKIDSRVVVIHKKNGGLSDARNAGLDIARGEYIGFVDSDDFIHPQMYEIMFHFADRLSADMVSCDFYRFLEGEKINIREISVDDIDFVCMNKSLLLASFYPENCYRINATVCNKLYKSKVFKKIRFPVGLYYEDSYIFLNTIEVCERIVTLPEPLYYYLQRDGSIMHSEYTPKWFQGTYINNNNVAFFRNRKLPEQVEYALEDFLNRFCKDKLAVYFLHPEYKYEFREVQNGFRREFFSIIKDTKICRMKKILAILLVLSPKSALKIAKKYFPECLYEFMR